MFTEKKTPTGELPDLNTTDGFVSAAKAMRTKKAKYPEGMEPPGNLEIQSSEGRVWCPGCEGRKVVVEMSSLGGPNVTYYETDEVFLNTWGKNQRYQLDCRQCDTSFAAMLFDGPEKLEHIIIPNRRGGYATPRTPEPVAYYLDQASRAEMTRANSAAVAMFRAALEQLFHHEGYTAGMLKQKINEAFSSGAKRAAWADKIDQEFVDAIKECGETSIHANDGTIEPQEEMTQRLLLVLHAVFQKLLRVVYELPDEEAQELAMLKAAKAPKPNASK